MQLRLAEWSHGYGRQELLSDGLASLIVAIMLIPQSMAYALLAGLPPHVGLYASILPLIAYAIFGTSRALAVGPVAVVSLLTASVVGPMAARTGLAVEQIALSLALLSGLLLFALGLLRLGFIANFLSHPVLTGFTAASAILIALGQIAPLVGGKAGGAALPELLPALGKALLHPHWLTLIISLLALGFLIWARRALKPLLVSRGFSEFQADLATRIAPVVAVIGGIVLSALFGLAQTGVKIVGTIPQGLPSISLPPLTPSLLLELLPSALIISLIGFVESVAVAQSFAAKRRERIDPDRELLGLGLANLSAAFSGGYPVTGGFSRSVVSLAAGAMSPLSGVFAAVWIMFGLLLLSPVLYYLPQTVLAATIIVPILNLVDVPTMRRTWNYSKGDFAALIASGGGVLLLGVEPGLALGVGTAFAVWLWGASRPHFAIVGLVPGTEHFRNQLRHKVLLSDRLLTVRVDESLMFFNARWLEELVAKLVSERPALTDLVLMCPAVNKIDASALESLERINQRLQSSAIRLHFSEVKGPVMDKLQVSGFLQHLSGQIFLTQYAALSCLDPQTAQAGREGLRVEVA